MRWCLLLGLVALTVSTSNDGIHADGQQVEPVLNTTMFAEAPLSSQAEDVETTTEDVAYEDDEYLDDESEFLPDPEALTDEEGDEEVVVLDAESRIVAEQLIQELDQISNKLQDDEETVGTSRSISSAEVKKLEKLLDSAGLSPNSPLLQSLMQQRQDAIPSSVLGPSMAGMAGLSSLLGGTAPIGSGASASSTSSTIVPGAMTKKNVEEIKYELKQMLFGPENPNQRRRQGNSGSRRPISYNPQSPHYSDTAARRPINAAGHRSRPQSKSGSKNKRTRRPGANRKAQNRQQASGGLHNTPQRPIPLFLRPPRPSRPGLAAVQAKTVPTTVGGRPIHNEIARQPISEFRAPASDFRLPEPPFRQELAFAPPSRGGNNGNNAGPGRGQVSPPVQSREQPNRNPPLPRPTEEQFRPSLLGRPNNNQQSPPIQFVQPPPVHNRQAPKQPPPPQQRPPIATSAGLPIRPSLGRPITSPNPATANFNPAPANFPPVSSTVSLTNAQRPKIIQPDCDLFSEGICLDVRNYPSELIANYLSRNKPALENMLAEVRSQSADDLVDGITSSEERRYSYNHYYGSRRQGEDNHAHRDFAEEGGFLCPSEVKYARPQLAQTSRGVWKYIINMPEHTQTIRMERCLKPSSGCSYVSPHYKSHCIQVYNYHRLLSFEEPKGMHVDIYKIPVGCSCHVQGYAYLYPPLDGKVAGHVIPPAFPTDNGNVIGPNRKTSAPVTPEERPPVPVQKHEVRVRPDNRERPEFQPARPESRPERPDTRERPESRERPEFRDRPDDRERPENQENFSVPTGLKDFSSFMDEQFSGHFGPFGAGGFGARQANRREDEYDPADDRIDQHPMESNPEISSRRRPVGAQSKTNYDYHPIIDFFHDKP